MVDSYFIKHIPVEGKIMQNDWFIDNGNIYKAFYYNFNDKNGNPVLNIPNEPMEDFSKIEFFLCTRDIHPGDICYDNDDPLVSVICSDKTLDFLQRKKAFKRLLTIPSFNIIEEQELTNDQAKQLIIDKFGMKKNETI